MCSFFLLGILSQTREVPAYVVELVFFFCLCTELLQRTVQTLFSCSTDIVTTLARPGNIFYESFCILKRKVEAECILRISSANRVYFSFAFSMTLRQLSKPEGLFLLQFLHTKKKCVVGVFFKKKCVDGVFFKKKSVDGVFFKKKSVANQVLAKQ